MAIIERCYLIFFINTSSFNNYFLKQQRFKKKMRYKFTVLTLLQYKAMIFNKINVYFTYL